MAIAITFLLTGTYSCAAFSHEGRPIYIELKEVSKRAYVLRWKIPPVMQPGTEPEINLMGRGCERIGGAGQLGPSNAKRYQCEFSPLNGSSKPVLDLQIQLIYPVANPALSTLVDFEKLNGERISIFKGPEILRVNLPSNLSDWEGVKQYIVAGFEHILEGYDHLLFVLCLVCIAQGLKSTLLTVTGFTLGHSITLGLASLNLFTVRVDIIEVLIPLSIMVLAAEIIRGKNPQNRTTLVWRYPVAVAGGFGLLHGFGFASALTELGLPYGQKMVALVGFNVGVEIGQVMFVLLSLFIGYLVKLLISNYRLLNRTLSGLLQSDLAIYPIGIASAYWFVARSLGVVV
ncbi:HupE/UreJ family protein [Microbulbifer sp. OS29]|uniref:HupE/UreJ family protein n=1 Tax=Microbulbifer okhotskensis TaxID=2926617 RepID=A0A9X2EV12_9GAMM|nr:HupE/UreJ family protein [Microbulbifer okhotskensis]MCO1336428.1 HupE/UreJ family protein [Microbulbifer okhotskensis]